MADKLNIRIDNSDIRQLIRKFEQIKTIVNPKKELRQIFIKAAKPIIAELQRNAPYDKGNLEKAIGVLPFLGSKTGRVFIGVRRDRVAKKVIAFYATFLEYGTKYIKKGKFSFFERSVKNSIDTTQSLIAQLLTRRINRI